MSKLGEVFGSFRNRGAKDGDLRRAALIDKQKPEPVLRTIIDLHRVPLPDGRITIRTMIAQQWVWPSGKAIQFMDATLLLHALKNAEAAMLQTAPEPPEEPEDKPATDDPDGVSAQGPLPE